MEDETEHYEVDEEYKSVIRDKYGYSTGTVKWYDPTKGYGFITPDAPSGKKIRAIFVHSSGLVSHGPQMLFKLADGDRVRFLIIEYKGKFSAGEVKKIA